eukprot:9482314-Pyramimonas_sp.AAC.1
MEIARRWPSHRPVHSLSTRLRQTYRQVVRRHAQRLWIGYAQVCVQTAHRRRSSLSIGLWVGCA